MLRKKTFACLLVLVLLFLTACSGGTGTQDGLLNDVLGLGELTADTGTMECTNEAILLGNTECEDPLRICIDLKYFDSSNETALNDFLFRLKEMAGLEDVVLEIIPNVSYNINLMEESNAVRANVIDRIQAEIMDGGGPDVFIAEYQSGVEPVSFFTDYDAEICLFKYPEKAMEYGRFLPLDELMENNTRLTEWDKLTQPVLEAGRNWEGQQIIPLTYTFPLLCLPKSEWEHVPDKAYTWKDMMENPDLLPYSLDIANCGREETYTDMTTLNPETKTEFFSAPSYIEYVMGKFADFENNELGFTEEELLDCVNDIVSLSESDSYEEFDDAKEENVGTFLSERTFNKPMTFLPIYSADGGITAHIKNFAAVNRNTDRPEDAFKVIDLLMSKYVQRWAHIYDYVLYSFEGIPLHEDLFQESDPLIGNNYYMRADNFAAFCKVRDQITAANFDSEGISRLSNMMSQCMDEMYLAESGRTVEDVVHEAYEEMLYSVGEYEE